MSNLEPYFKYSVRVNKATQNNISTQTAHTIHHLSRLCESMMNNFLHPVVLIHHQTVSQSDFPLGKTPSNPSVSFESDGYHKIKPIMGIRQHKGRLKYLVQIIGESMKQSIWVPLDQLDAKARKGLFHPLSRQAQPQSFINLYV